MTIEQQIAALTTATTDLLDVVNVKKATLDAAVSDASNAAVATAADRVQTGLDAAATAADRIQTGLDRTQTGEDRVATAADRAQTGEDRVATAADRVQTGLDVLAASASASTAAISEINAANSASASATSANNSAGSAVQAATQAAAADSSAVAANMSAGEAAGSAAQALALFGDAQAVQTALINAQSAASLAEGHAAAASSVVQQDLSGVTAAALHRSPNAVTAMFVYDTSKDSDGGAWTEKCQHTSWYNEELCGKWLGAEISEQYARFTGAAVGEELLADTELLTDYWVNQRSPIHFSLVNGQAIRENNAIAAVIAAFVNLAAGKTYRVRVTLTNTRPIIPLVTSANYGFISISAFINGQPNNVLSPTKVGNPGDDLDFYITPTVNTNMLSVISNTNTYTDIESVSCREVIAQTTQPGDYFQLTTDGKFYKLNDTSGITEVFRGNKRDFPRLAGIVAEAENVTIYDLTEPGCPMFARFVNTTGHACEGNTSSLAAQNGLLVVGSSTGEYEISFAKDSGAKRNVTSYYTRSGNLANRNATATWVDAGSAFKIANSTVNSVTMTVLPDAPVDPVTGLKVPTIAVATAGGVSVIKHNGTVENKVFFSATSWAVSFRGRLLLVGGVGPDSWYGSYTWDVVDGVVTNYGVTSVVKLNNSSWAKTLSSNANLYAVQGAGINIVKDAKSLGGRAALARIAKTFNTGHMTGDIRRTYLSDNVVESVGPSTELVTNGTFDTDSGWTKSGSVTWSNGEYTIADVGGADARISQSISGTVAGRTYRVEINITGNTVTSWAGFRVYINTTGNFTLANAGITGVQSVSITAPTDNFTVGLLTSDTDKAVTVTSISIKEVVVDRSYKASASWITGTLTKSPVASNTQLVAYSGFSAENYLREPYSADLDFGTGEWSVGAWVNVPTGNAAAATIASREHSSGAYIRFGIDATNKLTATAFDGTTTRTVTTPAAYNTGTWLNARADYTTDGKLSIKVNGVEVASATGAPLLTLNNSNAVLTIGNSYALDAPFPGPIALVKLSATVPTAEQSVWMYEQEKQMFREGAQCCLPDSGSIVDLSYDDATDTWVAASATNLSEWSGLVRTKVTPVPAGSYSKLAAASGVKLQARTTTSPGVDVTIPSYKLREELVRRAEDAAKRSKEIVPFDFDTTAGQTEFALPVGYTTKAVYVDGAAKRQGSTKDYTLLFDGFKETVKFAVAPAAAAWVQIHAIKE